MVPSQNRVWRRRSHYCVLTVLGDLLDGGELHFVEAAQTVEAARRRIEALGESKPGQYIIYNKETGERFYVMAGAEIDSEHQPHAHASA